MENSPSFFVIIKELGSQTNLTVGAFVTGQTNLWFVVDLKHHIVLRGAIDVVSSVASIDAPVETIHSRYVERFVLTRKYK